MSPHHVDYRDGTPGDAAVIAALATQVFLDTYATEGVRPDLAIEAFEQYSAERFSGRLAEPGRRFLLAENGTGLLGFAELLLGETPAPVAGLAGCELVRLYVQPRAQRMGIGHALLRAAERVAADRSSRAVWLAVWEGNADAIAFYRREGYAEAGATSYTFQGHTYGNRVYRKALSGHGGNG